MSGATVKTGRRHGAAGYNRGCRCGSCRGAAAGRARRNRAGRLTRPIPDGVKHGASCYGNWDCRCEACTAGNSARIAAYRAAARQEPQS